MGVSAGGATIDATTVRGSWPADSAFAGMTTATPMVIAVIARAAMPQTTRETDVSYWFTSTYSSCVLLYL